MDKEIRGRKLSEFIYAYTPDLWGITAYYNPMGFTTRRENYNLFAHTLRQSGINLLTIECAFGNQSFTLPDSVDVIKVKSESMVWQKERLLNLAISWLPKSCHYVAWIDCDLIFSNLNWAQETVRLLDHSPVVQVFETCLRLPKDYSSKESTGNICTSFASITPNNTAVLNTGRFDDHGHTGYGWAARREVLDQHGLYELAIAGSADHYMAHAIFGDLEGTCVKRLMHNNPNQLNHFAEWSEEFYKTVQGNLGVVSGEIMHLWHGDLENRKYHLRHVELGKFDFNPYTDIIAKPGKALELNIDPSRQELRDWFKSYFASRQEDGVLVTV